MRRRRYEIQNGRIRIQSTCKKMAEEVEKAANDYTKGNYDPSYCNKKRRLQ